jgi:hypothetical protein
LCVSGAGGAVAAMLAMLPLIVVLAGCVLLEQKQRRATAVIWLV